MKKVKTLFLAANPVDTNTLFLDEEIRQITSKINSSEYRNMLELVQAWAVRPDDLLQHLNVHKPDVVHFSGHGNRRGEIVLMDADRKAKPVSHSALKALFTTLKDNIRIVFLNACYSKNQAEAINEVIDYVIGMNSSISDGAAITFSASFYRALAFNRTINEAFEQAKTAILLEGFSEEATPELLIRKGLSKNKRIFSEDSIDDINVNVLHDINIVKEFFKNLQNKSLLAGNINQVTQFPEKLTQSAFEIERNAAYLIQQLDNQSIIKPHFEDIKEAAKKFQTETAGVKSNARGLMAIFPMGILNYISAFERSRTQMSTAIQELAIILNLEIDLLISA